MARLRRLVHKIVWVNPLKGSPHYEPLARGMAAALPSIDEFLPGHNLESLEELSRAWPTRIRGGRTGGRRAASGGWAGSPSRPTRSPHLRRVPGAARAAVVPAAALGSAGPRRAPVHHRAPGVRAVVQAADLRARVDPRPDDRRRGGAGPALPHTRARDRTRPDRAHRGARDDDAAGLPRVPLAAHAGLGVPVGAVPRGGVPERAEGAALPEAARRDTRGDVTARDGGSRNRRWDGFVALLERTGSTCPRTTRERGWRASCGWRATEYAGLFAVAEGLLDHDEAFAQWRLPPRAHGRARDRRQARHRWFGRREYLKSTCASGSSPSSGACGATSTATTRRGRSGGPSVLSPSPRSAARAAAPASRLLRAHHPVDGGRPVGGRLRLEPGPRLFFAGTASRSGVELHLVALLVGVDAGLGLPAQVERLAARRPNPALPLQLPKRFTLTALQLLVGFRGVNRFM